MFGEGARLHDRYEVRHLIARGGMADVFLARDARLEREVAIKAFRIGSADPRRFEAETRILANLIHRNLIRLYDAGEHDGVPFVVLEHVDGPTLATRLHDGPLSAGEVRTLGVDLAQALDFVHARRIVHRDVKPSNVLLAPDGRALLGDFGVAVLLDATRLTMEASTVGTAAYLAPEQVSGEPVTPAADVYALGLVLLEALTGAPAYAGSFHEILAAKLRADPAIPTTVDPALRPLLASMTAREPSHRPSAASVVASLDSAPDPDTTVAAAADSDTTVAAAPVATAAVAAAAATGTRVLPATDVVEHRRPPAGASARGGGPPEGRRLAIAAAVVAVILALGIGLAAMLGGGGDGGDRVPAGPRSSTGSDPDGSPTTVTPTTAPPTTSRAATCAAFEEQKEALDEAKKRAEQTYRDDKDAFEDLKDDFEAQKKAIEQQKEAAGC